MQRWTVVVAIPAHDEQRLLGRCLRSVAAATERVRQTADVHVVVAADGCSDRTELVAADALAREHASIVRLDARNVGAARAAAVAAARGVVGPRSPDRVWIAMTDADSRVPADWLQRHVSAGDAGYDAVVGAITVDDWDGRLHPLDRHLAGYRRQQRRDGARPVHGANLGVSFAALQAVGGIPRLPLSEDAALVAHLADAGLRLHWDGDLVVRTSGRRSVRSPGGFSSLLDDLERAVAS